MADELLFSMHDISALIEHQRGQLIRELDAMTDERILNFDLSELFDHIFVKYQILEIELGTPVVDDTRVKTRVGRYGDDYGHSESGVTVDAQRYTLEIPFEGDAALLLTRGHTFTLNPPRGTVSGSSIISTIIERNPTADKVNAVFERFINDVTQHFVLVRP